MKKISQVDPKELEAEAHIEIPNRKLHYFPAYYLLQHNSNTEKNNYQRCQIQPTHKIHSLGDLSC